MKLTRYTAPSSTQLLHHIFDRPELVSAVRDLTPVALGKLIDHVGLEDAGELVALATLPQLERIFDDDLWRAEQPGIGERFDAQRFALWLGAMLEAGETYCAKRLSELPRDLVTLAVHRLVLVLDIEALAMQASESSEDFEPVEKALEDSLCDEWDEFRLIARDPRAWDTVLAALLTLDRDHSDELREILERCAFMSSQYIEEHGGLYAVLTAEESLEDDVAGERQDRRAASGFVSPADARAFLAGIAVASESELHADARDPMTRAYFRELGPEVQVAQAASSRAKHTSDPAQPQALATQAAHRELMRLLQSAQVLPKAAPHSAARLGHGGSRHVTVLNAGSSDERPSLALERALVELAASARDIAELRKEELSYLANVLISGCSVGGRKLRPVEALEAAIAFTNLGLELEASSLERPDFAALLQRKAADRLFRIGFRALQDEVVQPARDALSTLVERDLGRSTGELQRLQAAVEHGATDLLREELSAAELGCDEALWQGLLALCEVCPALIEAVPHGKHKVEEHARFIAHRTQLQSARELLGKPFEL